MGLEIAGNIGALLSGAVKGYQTQDELEIKKRALEEEKLLKQQAIEADLRKSGRIPSPDGGWVLSDEEKEKRELDSLYKQSQMELNKSRAKYYDEGGGGAGNLKIQSALVEKFQEVDPLTGNVKLSPLGEKRQQLILDAEKAKIAKLYGNISVPEAPSVAAKNKAEADVRTADLIKRGYKLLPDGRLQAPSEQELSPLQEAMVKEAASQGYKYDPITGKSVKLPWAKKEKEKDKKTIPATQAINLSAGKVAIAALNDLRGIIEKNKDQFGFAQGLKNKAKAFIGGKGATTARTLQSDLQTRGQTLSKFLEQGKLSDKDREFYLSQVPTLTDSPETAINKIYTLSRVVQQLHNENIEGLGAAGYDVSKFEELPLTDIRTLKTEKGGDDKMVELAKKALSSPNATTTQKDNARKFLKSKGLQ